MKDNDFRIRTVWVVFDFDTNAREIFRVLQRYNIVPQGILAVRVAGVSEYVCLESFTAHTPISITLDVADDWLHDSEQLHRLPLNQSGRQHSTSAPTGSCRISYFSAVLSESYSCCLLMSTKSSGFSSCGIRRIPQLTGWSAAGL